METLFRNEILESMNLTLNFVTKSVIMMIECYFQKWKKQSNVYVLCNRYAPTQDHKLDKNYFSDKIKEELVPFANEHILLGRDFNFYMDPKFNNMNCIYNRYGNFI